MTALDRLLEEMEIDAYMDDGEPKIDIRFPNYREFKLSEINVGYLKSQITQALELQKLVKMRYEQFGFYIVRGDTIEKLQNLLESTKENAQK